MTHIRHIPVLFLTATMALWQGESVRAVTRFVDAASASPGSPYTTWETAATNIQDALAPSGPGDEILVAPGLYPQGSNGLNINASVILRSTVPRAAIIDGQNLGPQPLVNLSATNILIEGFTIKNGNGGGYGGGVAAYNFVTPFVIRDCLIVSNRAYAGAGLYLATSGVVERCTVEHNTAEEIGGGVIVYYFTNATVRECVIRNNRATNEFSGGGGVYLYGTGQVQRCVIEGNRATYGGGIYLVGGSLVNSILFGNLATNGGGVYMESGAVVSQCTISSNSASDFAGGVYASTSSTRMRNCIVFFNEAPNYDDVFPGYPVTFSNTCTSTSLGDTNFTNAPTFAGAAPDFRLAAGSSCIDRGAPDLAPVVDFNGHPRPSDGDLDGTNAWDVGAYEYSLGFRSMTPGAGGTALITWDALSNRSYTLDVTVNPANPAWTNIGSTNYYAGPSPSVMTQSFPGSVASRLNFRLRGIRGP